MAEEPIVYAIIGGGIAGVYCAWRLQKKHGKKKKIVLFEYCDRIGGRFLTIRFPGSNLKAELGGMRYIPEDHPLFAKLVDIFKLEVEDFPMGYINEKDKKNPSDKEWGENNLAYFRGQHFKIKDFRDSEKSAAFQVDRSERDKSPNDLQEYVQKLLVPRRGNKPKDLRDWFEIKVFGDYLWKFGFWNLLYRVLSPEAYLLLKYGSGYDSNASNGNAVALLPIVKDYLPSTKYMTLKDGMMSLPVRLAQVFESLGGKILFNRRLESIGNKDTDGLYELGFAITRTEPGKKERTIDTGKTDKSLKARNVILAIPTVALQKINWKPLQSNKIVMDMVDSVIPQEAIKLALQYPYPWWKVLKLFRGRSITDLPLRQVLYFSDLDDLKKDDPFEIQEKSSLLLASYSDIECVPFWRGLEAATKDRDLFPGHPDGYGASQNMVREAHAQVMKVHGQYELPQPSSAAYYDWGDLPYGAAWHCWKPGYEYDKIIDAIRKPEENENVFICGESYSAQQGWAEGALNTAEHLLVRDLGLDELIPGSLVATTRRRAPSTNLRVDSRGRAY
jgi:lysine 2-monooxygenase